MKTKQVILLFLFVGLCATVGLHALVPAQAPQESESEGTLFAGGWRELGDKAYEWIEEIVLTIVMGVAIALALKGTVKRAIVKSVGFILKEPMESMFDKVVDMMQTVQRGAKDISSFVKRVEARGLDVTVKNQFLAQQSVVKDEYKDDVTLADTYREKGRFKQAIEVYEKLLSKGIEDPEVLSNLGICYSMHSDPDRAIEILTRAATMAPEDPSIRHNLGAAYYRTQNHTEAIKWLEESRKLGSENHQTFIYLGLSLWKMGKFQEAVDATTTVLDRAKINNKQDVHWIALANNNTAYYLFEIADATGLTDTERLDEARTMIERACSLESVNPKFVDTRGCIYLWAGKNELAYECFEESLGMEPRPMVAEHLIRAAKLVGK